MKPIEKEEIIDCDCKETDGCPTEGAVLKREWRRLSEEVEQLRVQLAGCGVAALCNTRESREKQKCVQGDYGWSPSYQDVVDAVGREIAYREILEKVSAISECENTSLKELSKAISKMVQSGKVDL